MILQGRFGPFAENALYKSGDDFIIENEKGEQIRLSLCESIKLRNLLIGIIGPWDVDSGGWVVKREIMETPLVYDGAWL